MARGFGRIPVRAVSPVIEGGAYPAKAVVGELIPIRAKVFREGHDAVNASVILTDPTGVEHRTDLTAIEPRGLDPWETWVRLDQPGRWRFRIEGWSDPWATWLHHAEVKLPAGIDIELVCTEGRLLLDAAASDAAAAGDAVQASVLQATALLLLPERPAGDLLDAVTASGIASAMRVHGPRELVSPTADFEIFVDRREALFASWYEFFPRSIGATKAPRAKKWTSGTFDSCHQRLEEVAAMGFDVIYLPPIHPIGSAFRKGRNNTLTPEAGDPGSPWAIGSAKGGHDAIHPDLGDWDSFDRFIAKAGELGLEVALDFALQASPDHPWVTSHPEWFTTRADGTIAYAENPPKKYQDIYPINFDNDPAGIYHEVLRILKLWISHGVKIFRVDNPHTKPVQFWAWIIEQLRQSDPDVLFLAEAFTRPEMMHALGKVGFHSSYTYFTWRNTKAELTEYLTELSGQTDSFFRPNFFVNTPDINPTFLQSGNPAAFAIRAVLAATLSPAWGVYSGFELFEHAPLKVGGEEYLDSEKYEYRPRDYSAEPNLNLLLGRLNQIRREHPALQQLRRIHFLDAPNDDILAFVKIDGDDTVIVVCSLNPDQTVETVVKLDYAALGLAPGPVQVRDELTGHSFTWGYDNFVRLAPANPAHVLHVVRS
ncbi:MAG: alpha-1,4-glucan--maltose-1-phosphate maltosyltransferase [Propionibacteriales bacterium]|nr:alpha-1,4-glucan--maltose-1-phosphate maltosyltransferase [Propionibacteriales bacterium]